MSSAESLEGGCNCGRNKYVVLIPSPADANNEVARVFFDNSHQHRKIHLLLPKRTYQQLITWCPTGRSQATPLSAWLRVPLTWYHSTTYAFFDDETHASIRKTYTSPDEQNSKRHFCGFCGTPLSYWTESPAEEAEYISLTLGTLSSDKLRNLEELGLLPKEATADIEQEKQKQSELASTKSDKPTAEPEHHGLPWFDTLVEGSKLGNMKMSMGSKRSRDGHVRVEWEVVEWTADGEEQAPASAAAKRKLGEGVDETSKMGGSN